MSYLIVDLADTDLEMANDPFLEAGISVPEELPYQKIPSSRNSSIRSVMKKKHSVSLVSIRSKNETSTAKCLGLQKLSMLRCLMFI